NLFKKYRTVTLKRIAKELDLDEYEIKGFRVNATGKPIFTELKIYHDVKKITNKVTITEKSDVLDEIAEIVTIYQTFEDKKEALTGLKLNLLQKELDSLSELNYTQTHSLSLKL